MYTRYSAFAHIYIFILWNFNWLASEFQWNNAECAQYFFSYFVSIDFLAYIDHNSWLMRQRRKNEQTNNSTRDSNKSCKLITTKA